MSLIATYPLTYWNYFLTLESDLANLSRFVEFSPDNFGTYSVEMARLLLASGSEVDVVLRQLCSVLAPDERTDNIETYRRTLESVDPSMATVSISLPRFGLELTPWESWLENRSPDSGSLTTRSSMNVGRISQGPTLIMCLMLWVVCLSQLFTTTEPRPQLQD